MEVWYPVAIRNLAVAEAGSYLSGVPFRGVLHTTESLGFTPSSSSYGGWHTSYPHFTIVERTSGVDIYQHIPIDRAARALRNLSGGVETNRARAIQIEIVGKAAESHAMSGRLRAALSAWMRWVEAQAGVRAEAPFRFIGSEAYGTSGAARMSASQWLSFSGWCGHQHVPENTHWDPGRIDIAALLDGQAPPDGGPPKPLRLRVVDVAVDDVLNVRAGPAASHPAIGTLAPDDTAVASDGVVDPASGWRHVEAGGGFGWASGRFLEPVAERADLRVAHRVRRVDADDTLNVRRAPGVEHPVVATLAHDASGVMPTGAAIPVGLSDWLEIRLGEVTGWVHGRYLEPEPDRRSRGPGPEVEEAGATVVSPPSDPGAHGADGEPVGEY